MARAVILLAGIALVLTLVNVLAGVAVGLGWIGVRAHALLAIPTNIAVLGAWTFVALYFFLAVAWVKQNVAEGSVPIGRETEALAIRSGVIPWLMAAVFAVIAAYVLGGGADTRAVAPGVHLGLALLALFLHAVAAYRTVIFVGMSLDLEHRIQEEQG